jgi:hypothetical protein
MPLAGLGLAKASIARKCALGDAGVFRMLADTKGVVTPPTWVAGWIH